MNAVQRPEGVPTCAQTPADGRSRALLCAHIGARVSSDCHSVPYSSSFSACERLTATIQQPNPALQLTASRARSFFF